MNLDQMPIGQNEKEQIPHPHLNHDAKEAISKFEKNEDLEALREQRSKLSGQLANLKMAFAQDMNTIDPEDLMGRKQEIIVAEGELKRIEDRIKNILYPIGRA